MPELAGELVVVDGLGDSTERLWCSAAYNARIWRPLRHAQRLAARKARKARKARTR